MVQGKLRKVKPSARNVVEKHKEILDQVVRELKDPPALKEGLQAFFTAGGASLAWAMDTH